MESTVTTSAQDIQAELDRILESTPFANAHRSQRFLRYIVEGSLKNQDGVSERICHCGGCIRTECFL